MYVALLVCVPVWCWWLAAVVVAVHGLCVVLAVSVLLLMLVVLRWGLLGRPWCSCLCLSGGRSGLGVPQRGLLMFRGPIHRMTQCLYDSNRRSDVFV